MLGKTGCNTICFVRIVKHKLLQADKPVPGGGGRADKGVHAIVWGVTRFDGVVGDENTLGPIVAYAKDIAAGVGSALTEHKAPVDHTSPLDYFMGVFLR